MPSVTADKETYTVTADELYASIAKTRKAILDLGHLRSFFPLISRREGETWSDSRVCERSIVEAVVALEADGLVDVWADSPRGWAIVLSALSAERLEKELDGTGLRWQPINASRRSGRNRRRDKVKGEWEAGLDIDRVVDPIKFDPIEAIEGRRPGILLGERLMWNGPDQMHGGHYSTLTRGYLVCPGCISSPITANRTCLCCNDKSKPAGIVGDHAPAEEPTRLVSASRLRSILDGLLPSNDAFIDEFRFETDSPLWHAYIEAIISSSVDTE